MPEKPAIILKKWLVEYIKNRDVFKKSIKDIEDKEESITVKYRDREELFLIRPVLGNEIDYDAASHITIVTLNINENFRYLVSSWHSLAKYPNLTIYFANPLSTTETKWIIRPHLHDKIADDTSLKNGLKSMFLTVEDFSAS